MAVTKEASWRGLFALGLATLVLASTAGQPSRASTGPEVRALYVGVADYKHGGERKAFSDLRGAPNDIEMMRRAVEGWLGQTGGKPVDRSLVLTDAQATRSGILQGLETLEAQSRPGDTIFFYFTGHGRRFATRVGDQPRGFNMTIAAHDALPPGHIRPDARGGVGEVGDIFDRELNVIIDRINARGVNVVTVFDSCNSGTATRSWMQPDAGAKRIEGTPELALAEPPAEWRADDRPQPGARAGYRIHFGAAPDGRIAYENPVEEDGATVWRSDFTIAFARALAQARPGVTYHELIDSIRTHLRLTGAREPSPETDGDLINVFLGERGSHKRIFEARVTSGLWTLNAGALSGVNEGAEVALFASLADALNSNTPPLVKATVTGADPWTARLRLPATANLPTPLYAREERRSVGDHLITASISHEGPETEASQESEASLRALLRGLSAVRVVRSAAQIGFRVKPDGGVSVQSATMAPLRTVPRGQVGDLSPWLRDFAVYNLLLRMDDGGRGPDVEVELAQRDCFTSGSNDPPRLENGRVTFVDGQKLNLIVRRTGSEPLWVYGFNLTADGSFEPVAQITMASEDACGLEEGTASGTGEDTLVVIVATRPVPALLTLGSGQTRSAAGPPTDPFEQLVWESEAGVRSARGPVPLGGWSARRIAYSVVSR